MSTEIKKILVPIDFSANAAKALKYALSVAKILPAQVEIMHVMQLPEMLSGFNEEQTMTKLKKIKQKIQEEEATKNITCKLHFHKGNIVQSICNFVITHSVDFIVIGSKGTSTIQQIFIGSTAKEIIHKAPCPVLAVPEHAVFESINKILLAVNYSELNDYAALTPFKELVKIFNSQIHILCVIHNHKLSSNKINSVTAELKNHLHPLQCSFDFIQYADVAEAIVEYAMEEEVEIIAMVTHEYSFLEKLFNKSITNKVVLHTNIPVLVLHLNKSNDEFLTEGVSISNLKKIKL